MKVIFWDKASPDEHAQTLERPVLAVSGNITADVAAILAAVRKDGDAALREFSQRFDGATLKDILVPREKLTEAAATIDAGLRGAIAQAKANISAFHEAGRPHAARAETMPGVTCELLWRPIETVGIYIPGGSAPLFSTALMLAVPADLAGCGRIVLCTPPQKDGNIHPAICAAALQCGIDEVYAVGGAQAIAAMAYGTDTIPKVDKIYGPGNAWVTAAKQLVSQDPQGAAIDLPAGPSEVMVIAGAGARPEWLAADLLAQAEHDPLAQAILVTTDRALADRVRDETEKQLAALPRRAIAGESLKHGRIIVAPSMKTAIEIANLYAPEHLIIHDKAAAQYLPEIKHAGSVFLGEWTPESAGDYASGTNHVLPTYGYARAYGGVSVASFMKSMTVQTITQTGLRNLGPSIIAMAKAEGLDAHAAAVKIRLKAQGGEK